MFIMDDEQSDVGTWMCHQRYYVEDIALNVGLHLISSSEGFQWEAGGSLPLGAVATATQNK
jgi:hypothetical protein